MRAPSLYGYFDSKHAVFDALFAEGCAALLERIDAALADLEERQAGPGEALDVAAELFFAFCVEDPPRHQLLFLRTLPGFEPSPDAYALAVRALDRLAVVLAAAGAGSREQVDLWTALFTGLATQQVTNDPGGDRWHRLLGPATAMFRAATAAGPRSPEPVPEAAPTIRP
jgi:AcrR family transcriptional regulator